MKMMQEYFYPSCGKGNIHVCQWKPDGEIRGIVQIIHGIAEYAQRYDDFAQYLNSLGYLVVAEDHMGHGKSEGGIPGYFHGGWFSAVEDSVQLIRKTQDEFPDLPYYILGHSMGSFMTRTILIRYPKLPLSGVIICGTAWMGSAVLKSGYTVAKLLCRSGKDTQPNKTLHNLMFGSYNRKIEHPRTPYDWLNRDSRQVDAYIADPLCGFVVTAGLAKDMLEGLIYIQNKDNLRKMNRSLPIYFIAGGDDPVGDYGAGVRKAAEQFKKSGMRHVDCRVFPLCRHEILNEINKKEIYCRVSDWLNRKEKISV